LQCQSKKGSSNHQHHFQQLILSLEKKKHLHHLITSISLPKFSTLKDKTQTSKWIIYRTFYDTSYFKARQLSLKKLQKNYTKKFRIDFGIQNTSEMRRGKQL
jgi:hypothetical protein